jgi:hypothetical protein
MKQVTAAPRKSNPNNPGTQRHPPDMPVASSASLGVAARAKLMMAANRNMNPTRTPTVVTEA